MKNSNKQHLLSSCCNANIKVGSFANFFGDSKPTTVYYFCTKCLNACDVQNISVEYDKNKTINRNNIENIPIPELADIISIPYLIKCPKCGELKMELDRMNRWNNKVKNNYQMFFVCPCGETYRRNHNIKKGWR